MPKDNDLKVYNFTNLDSGYQFSSIGNSVTEAFTNHTGEKYDFKNSKAFHYQISDIDNDYYSMYNESTPVTEKNILNYLDSIR